jgi:hypothetical protein
MIADLQLDAAGGLLGWGKKRQAVTDELHAAMPSGVALELGGARLVAHAADPASLGTARAGIEATLLSHGITATFHAATWDRPPAGGAGRPSSVPSRF